VTEIGFKNFTDAQAIYSGNSENVQVSITFGNDFIIDATTSTDYSLTISSNILSFNTTLSALNLSPFTLKSIKTPISSPSLPIFVSISAYYKSVLYLVSMS
jgi:hypothetical protein